MTNLHNSVKMNNKLSNNCPQTDDENSFFAFQAA